MMLKENVVVVVVVVKRAKEYQRRVMVVASPMIVAYTLYGADEKQWLFPFQVFPTTTTTPSPQ